MLSRTLLVLVAFLGLASAFNPTMQFKIPGFGGGGAERGGNRQQMGTQRVPLRQPARAGQDLGRYGPITDADAFELMDGRTYLPGDAATDDMYGAALSSPIQLSDSAKGIAAAACLGFAVVVPTILIKVVGQY